jgi:thymidylate synthase (FAD)
MPWNEVSRRYVDEEPEFFIPTNYRLHAENVKQGSSNETTRDFINPWGGEPCPINDVHVQHIEESVKLYDSLMEQGVCAEQARMVLPQNMMTEWIWSGTLGAWCDMLRLRLDPHTQYESRIVAQQARALIEPIFPVSVKALLDV